MGGKDPRKAEAAATGHLMHQHPIQAGQPGPAIFLRDADAEEAQLGGFLDKLVGESIRRFDLPHPRLDAGVDKPSDRIH